MDYTLLRRTAPALAIAGISFPLALLWAAGPAPAPADSPVIEPAAPGKVADIRSDAAFQARLVDEENKAKTRGATVQVDVRSLRLVDPDTRAGKVTAGEGHLHYQVDNGPVVATTADKLGFHELNPGTRLIKVTLVGNDHKPVSAPQNLTVTIPSTR
jgi:hypothetical protein